MFMYLANLFDLTAWAVIIEFIGALLIVAYVVAAMISLLRHGNVAQARLLVADGAITGLSFKLAGTLLKTIELRTWQQILMFVAIFVPRTVLKRLLAGREAGFKARRWVVERAHSWMNRFRRLLVRWEKKPENYLAFLHFACGLIAFRAAGLFG